MEKDNKIKILIDCHKFDEDFQGITSYIQGLYCELVKDNRFHYYFVSYNSELIENIFGKNDNITYLKFISKNKWIRLLVDLPLKIIKNNIKIAHFQYVVPPIKFCKYIVTIHDVLFLDFPQFFDKKYKIKNNFLFKNSARISEIVLTVSEYSKQRIQKHYRLKNEISVVPNAINAVFLNQKDKQQSKLFINEKFKIQKYFLLVSRIEPRKNHLLVLKTFVEQNYFLNYNLVLIGKRDLFYAEFENYFNQLSKEIKNKIFIISNIKESDLYEFYNAAEIFIYPSFAEGFGIPPLESLALKTPTICSNTTAMSDYTFLNNLLFNPHDKKDLHLKINFALSNLFPESIAEKSMKVYNWKNSAKKYIEILKRNE
jgi:glycosyltransferase involved in cell wall biosynthesis